MVYPPNAITELDQALYLVERTIRDGLDHGYFECTIRSEVFGSGKRRLVISASKSYQFVIPAEQVSKPRQD